MFVPLPLLLVKVYGWSFVDPHILLDNISNSVQSHPPTGTHTIMWHEKVAEVGFQMGVIL